MKIIASDYDGTINYQGKVSDEDKAAIRRFRQAGNKFGIVTGRDAELSQWIRQENGFEIDFIISCTGAFIRDGEGNVLYSKKGKLGPFMEEILAKVAAPASAATRVARHNAGTRKGIRIPVIFSRRRRLRPKLIRWVTKKLRKYPVMPYSGSSRNRKITSSAEV